MTNPADGSGHLHQLELEVKTELTVAEASRPGQDTGAPAIEDLLDEDAERYEVSLRTLLGAVEAAEDAKDGS